MKRRKPKPRMGRPPLADGEARTLMFTIRLNEGERQAIAEAAKRASKPDTQWARDALLALVDDGIIRG